MIETKDIAARAERYRRLWNSLEGAISADDRRLIAPLRAAYRFPREPLAAPKAEVRRGLEAAGLRDGRET